MVVTRFPPLLREFFVKVLFLCIVKDNRSFLKKCFLSVAERGWGECHFGSNDVWLLYALQNLKNEVVFELGAA